MEEREFRFQSKKEYEDELQRLIVKTNSSKKKNKTIALQALYEELVEEYLTFCANVNKNG